MIKNRKQSYLVEYSKAIFVEGDAHKCLHISAKRKQRDGNDHQGRRNQEKVINSSEMEIKKEILSLEHSTKYLYVLAKYGKPVMYQ